MPMLIHVLPRLKRIVSNLPRLKYLEYALSDADSPAARDHEYLCAAKESSPQEHKMLVHRKDDDWRSPTRSNVRHVKALLSIVDEKRPTIKGLTISNMRWFLLLEDYAVVSSLQKVTDCLTRVQFNFRHNCGSDIDELHDDLAMLIRSMSNLTILKLDLGGEYKLPAGKPATSIMEALSKLRGLKRLSLSCARLQDSILRKALTNNANSLRSLTLSNIMLLNDDMPDEGVTKVSWISFIMFLQSTLKLSYITLDQTLSTIDKDEQWFTHAQGSCEAKQNCRCYLLGGNSLRDRVERYILSGGECPIPIQASYFEWKEDSGCEEEWKRDHSWCYSFES